MRAGSWGNSTGSWREDTPNQLPFYSDTYAKINDNVQMMFLVNMNLINMYQIIIHDIVIITQEVTLKHGGTSMGDILYFKNPTTPDNRRLTSR